MTKVLVVEDEQSLREPLVFMLEKEGYDVIEAENGEIAIQKFQAEGADVILLDLMMPKLDGNQVCKQIRLSSNVPIIMLTAKDSEVDKVVGLEIGADDYVTKPYSTRELLARMKAVLRRKIEPAVQSDSVLVAGELRLDSDRHQVTLAGKTIAFPLKEFELLELLMENVNRVLTRGQIIDRVWGANYFGDTKTLDVHIKRLRSKIEEDPARPKYIQTVRGLGYKFEI
ncbi:MAG: response regulator transcription factor [Micrococcales bacterium]|jgi:two-component system, OmpR family, response regulator RegX3|nr:response regulator transcription factor [Micrococcales bacterium]